MVGGGSVGGVRRKGSSRLSSPVELDGQGEGVGVRRAKVGKTAGKLRYSDNAVDWT